MYRPAAHAIAARAPNQGTSFPARGKKLCGEEYLNQFNWSLLPQITELPPALDDIAGRLSRLFRRNAQRHRDRPWRESPGEHEERAKQQKLRLPAETRYRRFRCSCSNDQ